MSTIIYGTPANCDTIKKAKKYLSDKNYDFTFHDYRKDGISIDLITEFAQHIDWQNSSISVAQPTVNSLMSKNKI